MAIAINTHVYKELISTVRSAEKVGEYRILWGMITYPKLIYHEKVHHRGICKLCGRPEFKPIHGFRKVDGFDA